MTERTSRARTATTNEPDNRTRSRAEILEERRKLRFDAGGYNDIMTFPQKEGFRRRVVNIVGNRVDKFKKLGWSIVDEPGIMIGGERVTETNTEIEGAVFSVDRDRGTKAVLMEIPIEWSNADKALKEERIKETETNARSGQGADYVKPGSTSEFIVE